MVIGDINVGKTTAIARFVDGKFITDTRSTIGVDFSLKHMSIDVDEENSKVVPVALQIWDVAGEQKFRQILPYYIQGTKGLVLVFDNNSTLGSLHEWLKMIGEHLDAINIPKVLISAKSDLNPDLDKNLIGSFLKKFKMAHYFATSSKLGDNIDPAFVKLSQLIISKEYPHYSKNSSLSANL